MTHFLVLICFLHGKHGKHCWDNLVSPSKRERRSDFYQCFSAFPTEVERSFQRSESPSLCLYEAKVAVALLFDSSAWALELTIFLPAILIWVHPVYWASVSASHWAMKRTEWALKPPAVACSGWGSPAILTLWHTGQLLLPAALTRPSAVLGLGFEEELHHLPPSLMQRRCRRMQDSAIPGSACLWLHPQRC